MRRKKYFGKRALLNLPGHQSTAAIAAEIEDTSSWKPGMDSYGAKIKNHWRCNPNTTFSISDCSRTIDLSVSVENEEEFANSLYKIDTIVDALAGLRQGIVIERERYVERINGIPPGPEDCD